MFPADRTRFSNDLLECFFADNAESMPRISRTDAIGIAYQNPPPTPPLSPMAHPHPRPIFLSMGLLTDDRYRHYTKEHFSRGNKRIISVAHRLFRLGIVLTTIRYRVAYR